MVRLFGCLALLAGCAQVNHRVLDASHDGRVAAAERGYDLDVAHANKVREQHRQALVRQWHRQRAVLFDGEIQDPVVTADVLADILLCADPKCEQDVVAVVDDRYRLATREHQTLALAALTGPLPGRLNAYERIMAVGHNVGLRQHIDQQWVDIQQQYNRVLQLARRRYAVAVDESHATRERETQAERARVERENSAVAGAVFVGVAAAAAVAVIAASEDGSGSGSSGTDYAPSSSCPRIDRHDAQGCCSKHGGLDRVASATTGAVICLDGKPSPTCACFQ